MNTIEILHKIFEIGESEGLEMEGASFEHMIFKTSITEYIFQTSFSFRYNSKLERLSSSIIYKSGENNIDLFFKEIKDEIKDFKNVKSDVIEVLQ